MDELQEYLRRKMREKRELERMIAHSDLNHRQIDLLAHALKHADADVTFRSHQRSHRVAYQSARTDVLDLERRGLLYRRQVGKAFHFAPVPDIEERLRAMSG